MNLIENKYIIYGMKKAVNILILIITAVLIWLPFIIHIITGLGITVLGPERLTVQLIFVFACLAGIITTACKKQLNIEVLTSIFRENTKRIILQIISAVNIAVLTSLFFSVFPNYSQIAENDSVFYIPTKLFFSALPVMYAAILFMEVKRAKNAVAIILGLITGFILSTGSVISLLDLIFGKFTDITSWKIYSLLNSVFGFILSASSTLLIPIVLFFSVSALFGMPLYIVLAGIAYFSFMTTGGYVESIPIETYNILTDTSIAAIPMFTVAGYLLASGSAGKRLLEFVKNSVGQIRGGVVIAAVLVSTFFTTFTGASGVTILALGGILSLILTGSGYSEDDAEALITSSGSIGILLPPSLAVIVYGATNFMTVDIFALFKGAFLPGILLAISMIIIGIIKDKTKKRTAFSKKALWESLKEGIPELVLPVAISTGYFSGFFSLFETAAFAVIYAFILEVFIRKDFTIKQASHVILESIPTAGGVLVIIGTAKALALFLVYAGVPDMLSEFALQYVSSKYVFLLLLNILLLLVGCIMDLYSAILVVSPLVIPVAESFGVHPVHTGTIFLTNLALGFLTPPIGMNLFIASYTFKKPVTKIIKNILPYLMIQFIILMLITYIPQLSLAF